MKKFISLHIPKTGGGSFKLILQKLYKNNVIFDYEKIAFPPRWDNVDVIHGHFTYNKYYWTGIPHIVWLRDPVERIISHYFYKLQHKPDKFSKDIETFTRRHVNTQCIYTNGDLDVFDLILFTEEYEKSLRKFEKWANVKINFQIPRRNKSIKKEVSSADRKIITMLNEADIALYEEAKRRFL